MNALIWVDWVIIAIIGISTLVSLWRGFVREAMSLVVWIGAFIIARTFHPNLQVLLADTVETPGIRMVMAFAILFVGTLIVGALVTRALARLVEATGLSATDRMLGTFFGLTRGVLLVVVALALLRMTPATEDSWWDASVTVEELSKVEAWTRDVLGDDIERFLSAGNDGEDHDPASEAMREGARHLMEEKVREIQREQSAKSSSDPE